MLYGLLTLVELVLLVYCVLDIVRTPAQQARNLPKLLWLLLVVLLPVAGGIAWLVAGRPAPVAGAARTTLASGGTGRAAAGRPVAMSPDDDEDFLRGLRERAAEQRRRAEEEQRRRDGGGPAPAAPS